MVCLLHDIGGLYSVILKFVLSLIDLRYSLYIWRIVQKRILSSFLLRGSHNVSIHAKHLVAHYNEDTGYFRSLFPCNIYYNRYRRYLLSHVQFESILNCVKMALILGEFI